jgi:antitoxin component of MazEF toxin-antitoxin module
MEATVVKMDSSLGVKVPEVIVKNFNLKVGTIIEMNFIQDNKLVFRKKPKIREGWDDAFAQYALDGEDKPMLPDFLDSETDAYL